MDLVQDPVELASDMNDSSMNIPPGQAPITYKVSVQTPTQSPNSSGHPFAEM